jgi:FlaA1/EpsC-like NDP-sugar epimerase
LYIELIDNIYNALQDDISRELFDLRLDALMAGGVDDLGYTPMSEGKRCSADTSPDLILYGVGFLSAAFLNHVKNDGFNVTCFCDSNPEKWGSDFLGLHVISPDELIKHHGDKTVPISNNRFYDEIYRALTELGFPAQSILSWYWPSAK